MIAGMPGIGGSLGECQVCGKSFMTDILLGKSVMTGRIPGMNCDVAVHSECAKMLDGEPWDKLPDGPIRRAFEAQIVAEDETSSDKAAENDEIADEIA